MDGLITREQLYEEVWAEPMIKVAARYSVAGTYLATVCERLNVPRPEVGYWNKLAVGRAPPRPPLPAAAFGDAFGWTRGGSLPPVSKALPQSPVRAAAARRIPLHRSIRLDSKLDSAPVAQPTGRETLATKTERAKYAKPEPREHALVNSASKLLDVEKENDCGYLLPSKRLILDIFVSRPTLPLALAFANQLFPDLRRAGHAVMFAPNAASACREDLDERLDRKPKRGWFQNWRPSRPTVVVIGSVAIGLTIFEPSELVEVVRHKDKYIRKPIAPKPARRASWTPSIDWVHKLDMPTGRLALRASSPYDNTSWCREWSEGEPGKLGGQIPQIIRELTAAAPIIASQVEEAAKRAEIQHQKWLEDRRRWDIERAEQQRLDNIKKSREELDLLIKHWGEAVRVEGFLADIERRAATLPDEERTIVAGRLARAQELLGDTNALTRFMRWKLPEER
jgi:hypothetical protein